MLRQSPAGAPTLKLLLSLCALVVLSASAAAQPASSANYLQHLQAGVDAGAYSEIAVGWIDGAQRQTWFFGPAAKPTADSAFEIGATSEVFTGLLLAQAALEGKLRLQTTIGDVLGKSFAFADPGVGAIPLQDLATHRAGLPALPPNLFPTNPDDPYAEYSASSWRALLTHYRLTETKGPGYSVLDAGLLGALLGQA